jgi:hypothetical protein
VITRIPLTPIFESWSGDIAELPVVDTFEDDPSAFAYYEEYGWDKYHPINHEVIMLPQFGEARYFYRERPVVATLFGRNYRIWIESDYHHEQYEADGKFLILEETDEPETVPNRGRPDFCTRGGYDVQLFGQPKWVQGAHYPKTPDGRWCRHLITVENGWGDSGNWNILVGVKDDHIDVAYFEASCC